MSSRWMPSMAILVIASMTTSPVLAQSPPEASPPAAEVAEETPPAPKQPADAASADVNLRLAEVTVCKKVSEERAPIDAGESFPADVGTLVCFTDVREAGAPEQIFHRWYLDNDLVAEVPMQVKGPRWRCWSEKEILPGWSGQGRVEIVNESGEVLGETAFTLVEPEPVSEPTPASTDESTDNS